jgi:hypothetical protein
MPYRDLRQSPRKTLGKPTWRVKGFCVPNCVPSATESGGVTVSLCVEDTPDLEGRARSRGPRLVTWSAGRKGSRGTLARSLRPASMARCTGSSGGFASYRRDPLLGSTERAGVGNHVRAVECVPELVRSLVAEPRMRACYNFLYEIKEGDLDIVIPAGAYAEKNSWPTTGSTYGRPGDFDIRSVPTVTEGSRGSLDATTTWRGKCLSGATMSMSRMCRELHPA